MEKCGDLNQGIGDNIEVVRVNGNQDGEGLPESIIITAKDTDETKCYVVEEIYR